MGTLRELLLDTLSVIDADRLSAENLDGIWMPIIQVLPEIVKRGGSPLTDPRC